MRILYLHQYFNTPEDSGGTRSYELARRLVKMGHQVDMVTSDRKGRGGNKVWTSEIEGIRVHWIPTPYDQTFDFRQRIKAFLRFAIAASWKSSILGGDVIFASSTPLTIALPAIIASKCRMCPMVFEVRDLWPEVPIALGELKGKITIAIANWLEKRAYNNSRHIVALSPGMKDGILDQRVDADRVTVIPNLSETSFWRSAPSLGLEFRNRHEWLGERPLVVYTGTLGRVNGLGYMVRLAAATREIDPEIRFMVVGYGKELEAVRALAEQLQVLDANFFMMPQVPKRELPAILSAATMASSFVIDVKELWNNSANKAFDAFSAARPLLINHRGWLAELLEETGAGLVVPPTDLQAAARLLVSRLRDEGWVQSAQKQAFDLAQNRFNADIAASRLELILRAAAQ